MYERTMTVVGLDDALVAGAEILREAGKDPGRPVAVAVVDTAGDLVYFACMDGTGPDPRRYAIRKAYTAAKVACDTSVFAERLQASGMDLGLLDDPQLITFTGGVCLRSEAGIVGGIGVSGHEGEEDERLANVGRTALGMSE